MSQEAQATWENVNKIDETASCENDVLFGKESETASSFDCKPMKILSNRNWTLRNGDSTSVNNETYVIAMHDQIKKVKNIDPGNVSKLAFVTQRARSAFIGMVGKADLTFSFAVVSQVLETDESCGKDLNMVITRAKAKFGLRLNSVPIDKNSLRNAVSRDPRFASNRLFISKLEFVFTVVNVSSSANIADHLSFKSKQVA